MADLHSLNSNALETENEFQHRPLSESVAASNGLTAIGGPEHNTIFLTPHSCIEVANLTICDQTANKIVADSTGALKKQSEPIGDAKFAPWNRPNGEPWVHGPKKN